MIIHASAPGKLVLLGEFAVLEGAPAVVLAVDRRAQVTLTLAPTADSTIEAPDLGIHQHRLRIRADNIEHMDATSATRQHQLAVLEAVMQEAAVYARAAGHALVPVALHTDTRALVGADGSKYGFGASAAVASAAFAGLVTVWSNVTPSVHDTHLAALSAHRRAQGGGSGVDVAAACYGGTLKFWLLHQTPQVEPITLPQSLHLIAVWSGSSQSTPTVLKELRGFREQQHATYTSLINELADASRVGIAACSHNSARDFLDAMRAHRQALLALRRHSGVALVSPAHESIAAIVDANAGAYKPSGAGGDLGLAACACPDALQSMKSELHAAGFITVPIPMAAAGIQVGRQE